MPKKETLVKVAKIVIGNAAAIGASAIVIVLVRNNVRPSTIVQKVLFPIGMYGIAAYASTKAKQEVEQIIDDLSESVDIITGVAAEVRA